MNTHQQHHSSVWLQLSLLLSICAAPVLCFGHDEQVHERITASAAMSADNLKEFLRDNLGLNNDPFTMTPMLVWNPPPSGATWPAAGYPPIPWITRGAYWEDKQTYGIVPKPLRSMDHFYTLLPKPVSGITDDSEPSVLGSRLFPSDITDSFSWASQRGILGPVSGHTSVGPNTDNWPNARDYEYAALTSASKKVRDENLAHMLYALGHVLHLNQDLSQPDHVRNDNHFSKRWIEKYGVETYYDQPGAFPQQPRGWAYWRGVGFEKLEDFWDRGHYTGNASALDEDANGSYKLGLAEFSSGNFIGEDATYVEDFDPGDKHYFPYPSRYTSTDFMQPRWQIWMNRAPITLRDGTAGQRIYLKKVADGINSGFLHSRFLYLAVRHTVPNGPIARVVNDIHDVNVLQAYHSILIPKAIEYSAGILDYFFRGKLEVTVGPNTVGGSDPLQLTIKNVSGQDFKGGTFQLYWDNPSDDTRTLLSSFTINWNPVSGTLADNGTITATFTPPSGVTFKQCVLVYKGTIGTTDGTTPSDPVDQDIAIAAKTFPLQWPPFCYWTMEEESGDRVDVVQGMHLTPDPYVDPPAFVGTVGGKVNTALELYGGDVTDGTGAALDDFDAPIPFTGRGVTLTGWFKSGDLSPDSSFSIDLDADGYGTLEFRGSGGPNGDSFNLTSLWDSIGIDPPPAGVWHFFVLEVDPDTETASLEFDRGPAQAMFSPMPDSYLYLSFWVSPPLTLDVDEVGLFQSVLTPAQKDYLYNSGAGRTWPITLP